MDNASGGIGLGGLLTVVFITLKLVGVISWSWWWVLIFIWMPILLVGLVWLIYLVVALTSDFR